MKKVMVATAILAIGALLAACAEPAAINFRAPAVANPTVTDWSAQPDEMVSLMGGADNGNAPADVVVTGGNGQWSRVADEMLLLTDGSYGNGGAVTNASEGGGQWSLVPDEMQLFADTGSAPAVTTAPEGSGQWSRVGDQMLFLLGDNAYSPSVGSSPTASGR